MATLILLGYLAILVLMPLVAFAGPAWLLAKLRHPRIGIAYVSLLFLGVWIDRHFNWDAMSYPHPVVGDFVQSGAAYPYLALAFCYAAYLIVFPPEPFDVDPR